MSTKQKILLRIAFMIVVAVAVTVVIVIVNFRNYGIQAAKDKASVVSVLVKDGLTAHMVNGTMDKRQLFLDNIARNKDIKALWVVRGDKVINQFGPPKPEELPRDATDRHVLSTGQISEQLDETLDHATLRVTIPYTATTDQIPNCLTCHNAKNGDVLGAISMEFDIMNVRTEGIETIKGVLWTMAFALVLIVVITNKLLNPYLEIFESLKNSIREATNGKFTYPVATRLTDEAGDVARWYNSLLVKLNETFGSIEKKLGIFVAHDRHDNSDPLGEATYTVTELSNIYKFKKTIEHDATQDEIFERFAYLLHTRFGIERFSIQEINDTGTKAAVVYATSDLPICQNRIAADSPSVCRGFRTGTAVRSDDFPGICSLAATDERFICLPTSIGGKVRLLLHIAAGSDEELEIFKKALPHIENYLDEATPILETKRLMRQLRESALKDGLTGLYNRKFLDEYITKASAQVLRDHSRMGILMIDIDFFKMVNDTYGHDVGDIVIREITAAIVTSVREADLVIRYGGEEIVVLLHHLISDNDLVAIAEKIRVKVLELKIRAGADVLRKTVSIGAAMFPDDTDSVWRCIKFADVALYQAKTTGRNKVIRFKEEMWTDEQF